MYVIWHVVLIQSHSDSEGMQPGIKQLVICDKMKEYDYACNSWHHWSPLITPVFYDIMKKWA